MYGGGGEGGSGGNGNSPKCGRFVHLVIHVCLPTYITFVMLMISFFSLASFVCFLVSLL